VACRQTAGKQQLLRIVRAPQGQVDLDLAGRRAGRGAYVCASEECFDKAVRTKAFARALRVDLSTGDYERLREGFMAAMQDGSREKGMVEDGSYSCS
jgi:predicted RNA-binding protein YlxR (DUF448 family)